MTVYGLDTVGSRGGQTEAAKSQTLGKNDFLQLLVAQLQAQDPLNPMDATGFTAQLAQFSSLEQLQNIDGTLNGISTSQAVLTNSQAVGFIGKHVTAVGDVVQLSGGQSQALQFSLGGDAAGVYIKIYDQDGNFVRDIECGSMAAGDRQFNWDGRDALGNAAPDGTYFYEVKAVDQNDRPIQAVTFTEGMVNGVNFKDGRAYLVTENQEIPMSNIVKVTDQNEM